MLRLLIPLRFFLPKCARRSRAQVRRRGVIYAPRGSQTPRSRYTNLGHQPCPEHHSRLTGAAAGTPRAPQPRAGHKAPALLGHQEAGGCCRGALRNPPGKHKAPLAFPAAAVRSRMIHSPAKRSSLEEKYTGEKKENPHPYLSPYPQPFPVGPSISGVLTPGGNVGMQKTKRLGKTTLFPVWALWWSTGTAPRHSRSPCPRWEAFSSWAPSAPAEAFLHRSQLRLPFHHSSEPRVV